jgi:hypothetical protein
VPPGHHARRKVVWSLAMESKKPKGEVVNEDPLRFHSAEKMTVIANTPRGAFHLLKIVFSKNDGSVMVSFPYHGEKRGLLSEVDPAIEPDPKTVNLKRNGVVVDYDVKCSFHRTGWVVFSKTGETCTLPRRFGFPLDGAMGRLFELRAYGLQGLLPADLSTPTKDYRVLVRFPLVPRSIILTGMWQRKRDIAVSMRGSTIGPHCDRVSRADGSSGPVCLVGQPRGFPLRDHVIVLGHGEIPEAAGADSPGMVFIGGWDAHEGTNPATAKFLSFMYPYFGDAPPQPGPSGSPP